MYKILIVDDEENIRALLKGILSDVAEVYEAENGKINEWYDCGRVYLFPIRRFLRLD